MNEDTHDAQEILDRKALQNVRGLVDKLVETERTRNTRTLLLGAILFTVLVAIVVVPYLVSQWLNPPPGMDEIARENERLRVAMKTLQDSSASYQSNPRKAQVGPEVEPRFRDYVEQCMTRIRQYARSSPEAAVPGMEGRALVSIAIRFDGVIEDVQVLEWSGHAAIEPLARRMVRNTGSCGVFPEAIRKDTDILYVKRPLEFRVSAKAS